MQKLNRLHYLLMFLIITSLAACQKQNQEQVLQTEESLSVSENVSVPNTGNLTSSRKKEHEYKTFYGPAVKMGNGHARSWINISKEDNEPLALGIELTANSFQGLTQDPLNFAAGTFILKLHHKAMEVTPFDHITVNWEPNGHEPIGIYNVPHFDFHFYKISVADQLAITGAPTPLPPAGYLPASYVIQGGTVPQMGTHWLDPSSSELSPPFAFTHTFIYGSNNGHVHFLEPMITRAFLLSGASYIKSYPQPIHFSPSGTYYPTEYMIWKNRENGRSYVFLADFEWR